MTWKKHILTEKISAPVYVYDQKILERQMDVLNDGRPENLEIYYAMKANSNAALLKIFQKKGFGTEIASGGELFLAQTAGFDPKKILYTGPTKLDSELEESVRFGIKTIHVESFNEAIRLDAICEKLEKKQDILVRVNPEMAVKIKVQLSGKPSPFGISEEDLHDYLPQILELKNINFKGIHVYNASGNLSSELLAKNVENVFHLVQEIEEKYKEKCEYIDFGGGFGIDYSGEGKNINVQKFYKAVKKLVTEFRYENRKLIMEIGRFFIAECGNYVAKIIDKKVSRGKTFLLVDGGIHHLDRPGRFEWHPVSVIRRCQPWLTPTEKKETVNITGSLCTNIDVLAEGVELPKCEISDYIVVENAGAYALNASINHFLSHEMPTEVLVNGEDFQVIRKKGRHEDLLLNQRY